MTVNKFLFHLSLLAFNLTLIQTSFALECPTPSVAKQSEAEGDTLHSWCEQDGQRQGIYEVFSMGQGLLLRSQFRDGQLNGAFLRFQNERVLVSGEYQNGKMHGLWSRYWPNGKLRDQGRWEQDLPMGRWTYYDEQGQLKRTVEFQADGSQQVISEGATEAEHGLVIEDPWRIQVALINLGRTRYDTDDEEELTSIALTGERHLFHWKRWIRGDLTVRVMPEPVPVEDNVISGQIGLSLDLLRQWTDPLAFYFRLGVHFQDFSNENNDMFAGVGLRYHINRHKTKGTVFSGLFVELGGVDYPETREGTYFENGSLRERVYEELNYALIGVMLSFY